ncbi:hypothetical protein ACOZ4I_20355 (plasmid) [Haloarcula salina]|uniref:hypothetical protein n=1 Tax=Haloarcula salina TaxID=1429914 RepID=UPI003C6F2954
MRPGTKTGSSDSREGYKDQVKPDLLDFLFTLSLTIGIAPELVGQKGLLSENWSLAIPDLAFLTNFGTFMLGVSTLLFSWYGFNASISNNPVLYGSVAGMLRFFLDAFLVVIYGFMLIVYEQLEIVAALLALIFFLYTVWDGLKLAEYRKEPFDRLEDQGQDENPTQNFIYSLVVKLCERRSLIYFVLLLLVSIFEFANILEFVGLWKDSAVLLVLFGITIVYRIDKVDWTYLGDKEKIVQVEETDSTAQQRQANLSDWEED